MSFHAARHLGLPPWRVHAHPPQSSPPCLLMRKTYCIPDGNQPLQGSAAGLPATYVHPAKDCLLVAAEQRKSVIAVEGDVRLISQMPLGEWVIGQPEIFILGAWHQICGSFLSQGATVACRQAGYGAASVPANIPFIAEFEEIEFTAGSLAVEQFVEPTRVRIDLNCSGTEASLLDCSPRRSILSECRQSGSRSEPTIACVADDVSGTKCYHTASGACATLNGVWFMPVHCAPILYILMCAGSGASAGGFLAFTFAHLSWFDISMQASALP